MTLAMLQRRAAGAAKLSPDDRRIASRVTTFSALAVAVLCIVLTRIYREAAPVQALVYAVASASLHLGWRTLGNVSVYAGRMLDCQKTVIPLQKEKKTPNSLTNVSPNR